MERLTNQFPELAEKIKAAVLPQVSSFIVDSELVAFDKQTKKYLPF
jgi:DNA ligase-1